MFIIKDIALRILDYDNIRELVIRNLRWALSNKDLINQEPYPRKVLGYIVEVVVTKGYWRKWFKQQLIEKLRDHKLLISNDEIVLGLEEYDILLQAVSELAEEIGSPYWNEVLNSLKMLHDRLIKAGSIKEWINTLYRIVSSGGGFKRHEFFRNIKGLGPKSVDMILRDMGYFDRIPIDRHERRFLLRTGIALVYGPPSGDPVSLGFYSEALRNYCRENLKNIRLEEIPLDSAPGVLDWAIWYFSCERESEECKAICSSRPRCEICPLRDICLYRRLRDIQE